MEPLPPNTHRSPVPIPPQRAAGRSAANQPASSGSLQTGFNSSTSTNQNTGNKILYSHSRRCVNRSSTFLSTLKLFLWCFFSYPLLHCDVFLKIQFNRLPQTLDSSRTFATLSKWKRRRTTRIGSLLAENLHLSPLCPPAKPRRPQQTPFPPLPLWKAKLPPQWVSTPRQ